jgi:ketosteroid isomerase-like protein
MKKIMLLILLISAGAFAQKAEIGAVLDAWHKAAAEAKFDTYFSFMSKDAVFIGTAASEHWNIAEFKAYSKPYFDTGKAWSFTPVQRNIYLSDHSDLAWFDELLDTQMKICRGSGVMKKENGKWKITQYVLSMTIPNELADKVISIKKDAEEAYLKTVKK